MSSWWDSLKSKIMGPAQPVADKMGLPAVKPSAPSEGPTKTITGGRRAHKTRKNRKHSKKTHKRK